MRLPVSSFSVGCIYSWYVWYLPVAQAEKLWTCSADVMMTLEVEMIMSIVVFERMTKEDTGFVFVNNSTLMVITAKKVQEKLTSFVSRKRLYI